MAIRDKPRIKKEGHIYCWHDWQKGDYTKILNTINYSEIELSKIPKESGIYFFYSDHDLLYIGMSRNLKTRISVTCFYQ